MCGVQGKQPGDCRFWVSSRKQRKSKGRCKCGTGHTAHHISLSHCSPCLILCLCLYATLCVTLSLQVSLYCCFTHFVCCLTVSHCASLVPHCHTVLHYVSLCCTICHTTLQVLEKSMSKATNRHEAKIEAQNARDVANRRNRAQTFVTGNRYTPVGD